MIRTLLRPLPLILILVVTLTGIGLGAARGSVRVGDQVVLCTGHGVVVTRLPGGKGVAAHLCPDMALSWLAMVDPGPVLLARAAPAPWIRQALVDRGGAAAAPLRVRVRGPPVAS